jgi:IS5 family transposase
VQLGVGRRIVGVVEEQIAAVAADERLHRDAGVAGDLDLVHRRRGFRRRRSAAAACGEHGDQRDRGPVDDG